MGFSIFLLILGLAVGSFLNVVIYRLPKGLSLGGRSFCPKCGRKISWFDNIPLISFLSLAGKCRNCKNKISLTYPLVELACAGLFVFSGLIWIRCSQILTGSVLCGFKNDWGILGLILILFLFALLISVFVIDLAEMIIPDELILPGFGLFLIVSAVAKDTIFVDLLAAGLASLVLLGIHLVTRGRGMGLGDVKFALIPGIVLGPSLTFVWLFLAFLTGGIVGVILILLNKVKYQQRIAFGPFLIFSFVVSIFFGSYLVKLIFPY